MLRPRHLLRLGFAALLATLLLPVAARADGDPASDVLLSQLVYFPISPASQPVAADLKRATDEAKQAGAPISVALIGTPEDLGAVPDFFGRPPEYAKFLSGELRLFQKRNPLLVVMPAGFGTNGFQAGAEQRLKGIHISSGADSDDLARAATVAVQELAAAQGHPIKEVVSKDSLNSGGTGGSALFIVLGVLVAFGAAVALALRLRGSAAGRGAEDQRPGGNA